MDRGDEMDRGFLVRAGLFVLGAVPMAFLLNSVDLLPKLGALVVYAFVGNSFIGHYLVRHPDAIPPRRSGTDRT
jgi:hypothetical protein